MCNFPRSFDLLLNIIRKHRCQHYPNMCALFSPHTKASFPHSSLLFIGLSTLIHLLSRAHTHSIYLSFSFLFTVPPAFFLPVMLSLQSHTSTKTHTCTLLPVSFSLPPTHRHTHAPVSFSLSFAVSQTCFLLPCNSLGAHTQTHTEIHDHTHEHKRTDILHLLFYFFSLPHFFLSLLPCMLTHTHTHKHLEVPISFAQIFSLSSTLCLPITPSTHTHTTYKYIPLCPCLLLFLSSHVPRTFIHTHTHTHTHIHTNTDTPPAVQLPLLPAGLGQLSSSGLSGPSGVQCPRSAGPLPAAEPPRMNTASSSTICTRQSSAVCPVTQLSEVIESRISHLKGASFCFDGTCAPHLSLDGGWRSN